MTKFVLLFALLVCALYFTGTHAYSVSGTNILDPNGNHIILRGVDRCSMEWSQTGENLGQSDYALMKGWGANIVRLSLNQDFYKSASYVSLVAQQVAWIKAEGMGVILDLHWSDQGGAAAAGQQCMADTNSLTFWTNVATAFKNDPWVMFELYNEPFVTDWGIWRNGGSSSAAGCGGSWTVGMQQLYNAVRATGANNVVIVGGVNYAFDLTGVATHALTGSNIVYNTHPYDYGGKQEAQWDADFGYLTSTYPVFATEFGQYCNNDEYVQDLLAYFQTKGIHWTAWAWYVNGCSFPSIIADWSGTPLGTVGALVKSALSTNPSSGSATTAKSATTTTAKSSTTTTAKSATSTTTSKSTTTTAKSTTSTTAKSTTTGSSSSGTTETITIVVNQGTNNYWYGIDSIGGLPSSWSITGIQIKDSSSGAGWKALTKESYGTWILAAGSGLTAPLSLEITTASNGSAELDKIIPNFTPSVSISATATFK